MRPWKIPFAYLRMLETTIIIDTLISRILSLLEILSEFNHNYLFLGIKKNGALDLKLKNS